MLRTGATGHSAIRIALLGFIVCALIGGDDASRRRRRRRRSSGKSTSKRLDALEKTVRTMRMEIQELKELITKPSPPPPPPAGAARRRRTRAPPPPPGPAPTPPPNYGDPDAAEWLLVHNYFRCIHTTKPVGWDSGIAAGAAEWAQKGQMSHAPSYTYKPPKGPAGENLAAGYGDITTAVTAWYNENPERGWRCGGHCTALLFKTSTVIGCSKKDTWRGRPFYVCRYAKGPSNYNKNANSVNMPDYSREPSCFEKFKVKQRWKGSGALEAAPSEGHEINGQKADVTIGEPSEANSTEPAV